MNSEFDRLAKLLQQLDSAVASLKETRDFAKPARIQPVLDICRRVMSLQEGVRYVYERIKSIEQAGVFSNSDWEHPERLQSSISASTILTGQSSLVTLELLSLLRFAAVSRGDYFHTKISAELATHFLSQSLALNLTIVFGKMNELERSALGNQAEAVEHSFKFLAEQIGYANIIDQLIQEIWRLLSQRPVRVDHIKNMITHLSVYLGENNEVAFTQNLGAERLVSALFSPTRGCQEDPGLDEYQNRLQNMDEQNLRNEALGFSRAMHDTGLVSPYHAVFLRYIRETHDELISTCLGLSSTGNDSLLSYKILVNRLIGEVVWPETAQVIFGLHGLLERGILYDNPIALAFWRQINLPLSKNTQVLLGSTQTSASAKVVLLAGIINLLGQPLGLGQGNNPLCQSVRALSMWADNDPNYLMHQLSCAARDNDITMYFEGQRLSSAGLLSYYGKNGDFTDLDPVSTVIVPHLDVIYKRMGEICSGRGEDIHKWVNPEFHGWWVKRDFAIAVDINTGFLAYYEEFLRKFYANYHPLFNGNSPVVNPQPAGIASTDSMERFLGWHAISILRVGFDPDDVMRVYFYNPNNDSGQNWGGGIEVSTTGHGERFGESSLCFSEFASRLYLFHYDQREESDPTCVSQEELDKIKEMAVNSWAKDRVPA
jgi:hypothetical protein